MQHRGTPKWCCYWSKAQAVTGLFRQIKGLIKQAKECLKLENSYINQELTSTRH